MLTNIDELLQEMRDKHPDISNQYIYIDEEIDSDSFIRHFSSNDREYFRMFPELLHINEGTVNHRDDGPAIIMNGRYEWWYRGEYVYSEFYNSLYKFDYYPEEFKKSIIKYKLRNLD